MGVFDVSALVAVAISYQLSFSDSITSTDLTYKGMSGVIIFVIIICSVIGFLLLCGWVYCISKLIKNRKRSLINTNNELSNKRNDTFTKNPLTKNNPELESEENKGDTPDKLSKLSNFLVSQD